MSCVSFMDVSTLPRAQLADGESSSSAGRRIDPFLARLAVDCRRQYEDSPRERNHPIEVCTKLTAWATVRRRMTKCAVIGLIATLFLSAAAAAGTEPTTWSLRDMTTAVRGIGYPKPHVKKLSCTTTSADAGYSAFRCSATYARHRRSTFVTEGVGQGGWICAGRTLVVCKLLQHGFVTTAAMRAAGSTGAAADLAAMGYLVDHNQAPYQRVHFCAQAGATKWSCPFTVNNATVTVTLVFKPAKGGYVLTGTSS